MKLATCSYSSPTSVTPFLLLQTRRRFSFNIFQASSSSAHRRPAMVSARNYSHASYLPPYFRLLCSSFILFRFLGFEFDFDLFGVVVLQRGAYDGMDWCSLQDYGSPHLQARLALHWDACRRDYCLSEGQSGNLLYTGMLSSLHFSDTLLYFCVMHLW